MNLKKITGLILASLLFIGLEGISTSYAIGNIWMDEHADIQAKQYKKVVLFPLRYLNAEDGNVDEFQGYNNYLHKQINKHVKRINFLGFGNQLEEKKHILRDNPQYDSLTRHFNSEEERAKAVYDITAADGYLLPHIRWEKERIDVSPATWTTVTMESYYDEINGPDGDQYKLNHQTWKHSHLIPEHQSKLQMLDMDFTLYDAYTGKKAMTRIDYYRGYADNQWTAFKSITHYLTKDWSKLHKDKDRDVPAGVPTLGFRNFSLPWSASQDEFAIKTIYYAIKDEAGDTLKKVKVDYSPDGGQYYVTGDVTRYDRGETWNSPYAMVSPHHTSTQKFTWTDNKGYSHTGERRYYSSNDDDITDHFGYYSFWYTVGMNLRLVDASTGNVIYSESNEDTDPDFYGDALRHILNKFYKNVDKLIGIKDK